MNKWKKAENLIRVAMDLVVVALALPGGVSEFIIRFAESIKGFLFKRFIMIALTVSTVVFADTEKQQDIVVNIDFETDQAGDDFMPEKGEGSYIITKTPGEVIEGVASMKGDSTASEEKWNEFFHSRTGIFKSHEFYKITFDYKILSQKNNAKFYTLLRSKGNKGNSGGWGDLLGKPGEKGTITNSFWTKDTSDYYMIIGINGRGAIAKGNPVAFGTNQMTTLYQQPIVFRLSSTRAYNLYPTPASVPFDKTAIDIVDIKVLEVNIMDCNGNF